MLRKVALIAAICVCFVGPVPISPDDLPEGLNYTGRTGYAANVDGWKVAVGEEGATALETPDGNKFVMGETADDEPQPAATGNSQIVKKAFVAGGENTVEETGSLGSAMQKVADLVKIASEAIMGKSNNASLELELVLVQGSNMTIGSID